MDEFPTRLRRAGYQLAYPLVTAFWTIGWRLGRVQMSGAKCVLLADREVLMIRQTYGPRAQWNLPGGLIHRGERPEDAAARELREELDLEGLDLRPLGAFDLHVNGRIDEVHLFAAELTDRSVRANRAEIAEVRWFPIDALPGGIEPSVRAAIEALASA